MAEFVRMPTLGFDMEEGTMGTWMVEVGQTVAKGDVLAEIESDKVTQELTARASGVLLARAGEPGEPIPVGVNLGIIGEAGEDVSGMLGELYGGDGGATPAPAASAEAPPAAETAPAVAAPVAAAVSASVSDAFPQGVKATPVARRIAADKGIDLRHVNGSGPGGRVRKADVEQFAVSGAPAPAAAPIATTPVPAGPATEEVPLTRLRKAIARRMTESTQTIPQFTVTTAIDMTDALALRKQVNAALPEGEKVSVNDLIVKACGLALRQYPNINSSWGGEHLVRHNRVNVGTAVAVEGGLLTVTQKDTDRTPLAEIARQNRAMIGRAREGKVKPEDVSGSTFSTSNLGAFDVDQFVAIINPPEAAILAIGSAAATYVVKDGDMVQRSIMKVTCSADHRVTDGAEVAQFLQYLKGILETPLKLLV